jgi:uncharacterized Fe-S cluster protein YjdI
MAKEYTKDGITILWDSEKCIHCGKCAIGLSNVFKPRERPWIQLENDTMDNIVKQVKICPSGALTIK